MRFLYNQFFILLDNVKRIYQFWMFKGSDRLMQ